MSSPRYPSAKSILRGQTIGFFFLLAIIWAAEILHLPHRLFGESPDWVWSRVTLRTLVVLVIWLIVHLSTSRLLKRMHELESYLRVCSWCRKVDDKGEWLAMEEYFDTRFHTGTSHGICPTCARNQMAKHLAVTRAKSDATPQA